MNELVHEQWFEDKFHDPVYSERLFHQVKALDPQPTLMLNEFHVVAEGDVTDVSALCFVNLMGKTREKGEKMKKVTKTRKMLIMMMPMMMIMKTANWL